MELLRALLRPEAVAAVSLGGYPLGWLRAPPGWSAVVPGLDEHLLYLVDAGRIALEIAGRSEVLDPGTLALIPPRTAFRASLAPGPRPAFWRLRLTLPARWEGSLAIPGCRDLEAVVSQLVAEAAGDAPWRAERVRGLLLALVVDLARRDAPDRAHRLDPAARARLERHADADPTATPRDLARQLDLTLDYFTRVFRRTYGRPPRRWLLERRMHAAAVLVAESGKPIARIADELGYADPRLFVRQFRQVLGQPPGRFRERIRAG